MTLGCGSWGGNVTSDNISPRHLLDVNALAFETKPINHPIGKATGVSVAGRVDRASIAALVDRFLADRIRSAHGETETPVRVSTTEPPAQPVPEPREASPVKSSSEKASGNGHVYDFVCEDDVRRALMNKEKIYVNGKTIITPAARELGEAAEVFAHV